MQSYAPCGKFLQFFRLESRPLYSSEHEFYYVRRFSELMSVEEMAAVEFAVNKVMGIAPKEPSVSHSFVALKT